MTDDKYISAKKLKAHYAWWGDTEERKTFDAIVDVQPAADVKEVRHGTWIPLKQITHRADTGTISTNIVGFYCSLCGSGEKLKYRYCHCGAKMDGKENEK